MKKFKATINYLISVCFGINAVFQNERYGKVICAICSVLYIFCGAAEQISYLNERKWWDEVK
jgi:hypothetical protein